MRRELGEQRGVSSVLSNLAMVALDDSDPEAAGEYLREGLAIDRHLGDAWGVALTLANLGLVDVLQGDVTEARRHSWARRCGRCSTSATTTPPSTVSR